MKLVMCNQLDLLDALHKRLYEGHHLIDLESVRSYVSSPRLMDVRARNFPTERLIPVGDTFLDHRTMLADGPQKTFGISLIDWMDVRESADLMDDDSHSDGNAINVQVWPFDPSLPSEQQARLAIALSYTRLELYAEPRIIGALNDILESIGFFIDPERY